MDFNEENTTKSQEYGYVLYDVLVHTKNFVNDNKCFQDEAVLDKLKSYFGAHDASNVVYPTHDRKCYVTFTRDNLKIFNAKNLHTLEITDHGIFLNLSKDVENTGCVSEFAF